MVTPTIAKQTIVAVIKITSNPFTILFFPKFFLNFLKTHNFLGKNRIVNRFEIILMTATIVCFTIVDVTIC